MTSYYVAPIVKISDLLLVDEAAAPDPVRNYKKVASPSKPLEFAGADFVGAQSSVVECDEQWRGPGPFRRYRMNQTGTQLVSISHRLQLSAKFPIAHRVSPGLGQRRNVRNGPVFGQIVVSKGNGAHNSP